MGELLSIVGINPKGYESGNSLMTEGRDLPWLQEVVDESVWGIWAVNYRDVVILDEENKVLAVYNLTQNDLNDDAKYNELKDLLLGFVTTP